MTDTEVIACASVGLGMEVARQIAVQRIGVGAMLGAGSTITKYAPDEKLALERSKQLKLECSKRSVQQPKG